STVYDVIAVIRQRRPIAYTTVMTTMDRMAKKGLLHQEGKPKPGYVYTPVFTREGYLEVAVHQLCDELGIGPRERRHVLSTMSAALPMPLELGASCGCPVCRPRRFSAVL